MIRTLKALKAASEPKTTLLCLSNANCIYIPTVLKANGIEDIFEEIITNPANWDPTGLLKLRRRVDPAGPQHACQVGCNANMCKGEELSVFLQKKGFEYDRLLYLGDGGNDFCPILRLRKNDVALVRKGRTLERRIREEGKAAGLVCEIKYWTGAWEVEEYFTQLLEART